MNTDSTSSLLAKAAQIAAIIAAVIAYLAFAYQIGWWPFDNAKVTPVSSGSVAPTLALTSAPTAAPTVVPPTATPTKPVVSSSSSTLGIGSTKISPIDGAIMVYVPAGEFLMGSSDADKQAFDNEKPQHTVYLNAFWIDKFEVTNALYKKCVDARKCPAPQDGTSYTRRSYYGNSQFDNYPVINVSWDDATRYCAWAGKNLPTEAEWEKAARGTDGRIYPWGNIFDKNLLNSWEGGKGDTTAVGSYPNGASPYGAMDMAGNVWEWVADWYDVNYYKSSPARNPKNETTGQYHVVRGGSWYDSQDLVRAAFRTYYEVDNWAHPLGFRCVE